MEKENPREMYFLLIPNNPLKADLFALPEVRKIDLEKAIDVIVLLSDFNFPSLRQYALFRNPTIDVRQELAVSQFKHNLLDSSYAKYGRLVCVTEKPKYKISLLSIALSDYNFRAKLKDLREE